MASAPAGLRRPADARRRGSSARSGRSSSLVSLVVVGHGDRGAGYTNRNLSAHCCALAESGHFRAVGSGVLKGEPSLEAALAAASEDAEQLCIYPFFMADGHFAGKVLRERIAAASAAASWHILPPLGLDERLAALIHDHAIAAATGAAIAPRQARLLIVGHGSRLGPASASATRKMAGAVAGLGAFGAVEVAFLEETPFLADALASGSGCATIVSGFFSGDGMHAGEDVPEAIATAGAAAVYAGPIGAAPQVADLILQSVLAWAGSSARG